MQLAKPDRLSVPCTNDRWTAGRAGRPEDGGAGRINVSQSAAEVQCNAEEMGFRPHIASTMIARKDVAALNALAANLRAGGPDGAAVPACGGGMNIVNTNVEHGVCGRANARNRLLPKTAAFLLLAMLLAGCMGYVPGRQAYWDAQVSKMCEKDGGTKIYEVVELPKAQYDRLRDKFGELNVPPDNSTTRETPFYRKDEITYLLEGNPAVRRYELAVIRRSDRKVLGKQVVYSRVGGDFPSPAHTSSFSCPNRRENLFTAVIRQRSE